MKKSDDLIMIISDFEYGGAQKVLLTLIKLFEKKKIKLIVIGKAKDLSKYKNISLVKLNLSKKSCGFFDALFNNFKIIKKIRYHIKKSNSKNLISFIYETNILSIISSINLNKRIIIAERNNPYYQKKGLIWNFLRLLIYPIADIIVVNSFFSFDYFNKFINVKKIKYIENPLVFKKNKLEKKKKYIFVASSLTKQKSIDTLIMAFAIFQQKNFDWKLIIAGEGPEENKLKVLASKLKIENKVEWLGFRKNIDSYFKKSSIFCLPSSYEGMSNSLLEALSYNLPCVVSNSVIHNNDPLSEFVLTFKKNNYLDLSSKLIDLEKNKVFNKNRFTEYAKEKLNEKVVKKKWEDLCF